MSFCNLISPSKTWEWKWMFLHSAVSQETYKSFRALCTLWSSGRKLVTEHTYRWMKSFCLYIYTAICPVNKLELYPAWRSYASVSWYNAVRVSSSHKYQGNLYICNTEFPDLLFPRVPLTSQRALSCLKLVPSEASERMALCFSWGSFHTSPHI